MPLEQGDWDRLPSSLMGHERAQRNELFSVLRQAIDEDLSGGQRTVFTAVTLHGVPAAALAAMLGSDRDAIYKALFEARRILRARLAATYGRDRAHLPGAPWTGPPRLDDLLAADPGDAGCEVAFHVLDRYAEAGLTGTGPESRFPGVAAHLRRCEACHQDYQGLLAAVARLRARHVCHGSDAPTPVARGDRGSGPRRPADGQRPPVARAGMAGFEPAEGS
jgi:hypothetical protein